MTSKIVFGMINKWASLSVLAIGLSACGGATTTPPTNPNPPQNPGEPPANPNPPQNPGEPPGNPMPPNDPANPSRGEIFKEFTDASCTDGRYEEELPNLNVDISKLIRDFYALENSTTEDMVNVQLGVYDMTYPYGAFILRESPGFNGQQQCAKEFSNPASDGKKVWAFAIHECGHALNSEYFYMSENYKLIQPSRDFFPRNELTKDRFHNDIPNASANETYFDMDSPTGHQGIQTMYDEWAQYIHSAATNYLLTRYPETRDQYDIDYMLHFTWATPRYFLWAKEQRPADFEALMNDVDVRESTLALWGQAWLYYDALIENTDWQPTNNETRFVDAIRNPALLEIMNEIRKKHGCTGI